MPKARLPFVMLLMLPTVALAQGTFSKDDISLPCGDQVEWVTPSTSGGPSSLVARLQRTEGVKGPTGFGESPRSEWLQQNAKRERGNLWVQQAGSKGPGWIRRHPALFGAMVGAGGGAVAAATMENELFCSGGDEDCLIYGGSRVLVGAGMGAGVGALVGWLVGLASK
jgi:hypothetical protein